MNDDLEGMWKEAIRTKSWRHPRISMERLRMTTKTRVRITGDPVKIRTDNLRNTSLEWYHYTLLFNDSSGKAMEDATHLGLLRYCVPTSVIKAINRLLLFGLKESVLLHYKLGDIYSTPGTQYFSVVMLDGTHVAHALWLQVHRPPRTFSFLCAHPNWLSSCCTKRFLLPPPASCDAIFHHLATFNALKLNWTPWP
jgi:hypothetical protein